MNYKSNTMHFAQIFEFNLAFTLENATFHKK